ncbi:hypothetical protein RHMOL_Rhmol01G0104800 [Rhododendron molle]|uniref:Uncharacterized protein n=1 Tax=Rhododendron molle TaxID=49168 RepID=A0ACC0Q1D8_RHOML|nr:hypothetical protein RHMOL_Rhmol01G0104800 [Rhododendron molle]
MNMSRPRGEPNLMEWARPLLIHKKKLLRILDPRMEGQYSTRTARQVACLAITLERGLLWPRWSKYWRPFRRKRKAKKMHSPQNWRGRQYNTI